MISDGRSSKRFLVLAMMAILWIGKGNAQAQIEKRVPGYYLIAHRGGQASSFEWRLNPKWGNIFFQNVLF
ncbi:MAG: hypothetical protein Q8939_07300 [Bacteroidota bacterium]|nr:hypothetical protein [Bacteroidota bacterium]